jgi:hypothetical protein
MSLRITSIAPLVLRFRLIVPGEVIDRWQNRRAVPQQQEWIRMKKHAAYLLMLAATCAQAEPSRLFSQETAEVTKEISVDLDYVGSLGLAGGLRIGAFGGEVLVNAKNDLDLAGSGFSGGNIGYKRVVMPSLALYGILAHDNPDNAPSTTDFAFGAAYSVRMKELLLNANLEYVSDDDGVNGRGDESTLFLKLGAGYAVPTHSGRFTLIGELVLEDNDVLDTVFNLGVRWEVRRNINVDFVVVNDRGDNGSRNGLPGAVRLNIAF